ncbi:MAG: tRNA pseudouridine synthase A [Bacteroidales bacterium]|nr:tRNA pseudouridine synthase A [Bacteroidales bacterium]
MRYCLCLSYEGADFCGWQIQPSSPSVQACLEGALSRLLNRPVSVTGAGRTDTAVNAVNYVAHFDLEGALPFEASDFIYKLNAILPRSVAVLSVTPVADDFHARFSARRREYTYFLHRQKDPFLRGYSWQCGYPVLDFDAMNEACRFLLGTHDFSCFEKTGTDNKTSICTVYEAFWKPYVPSHVAVMGASEEGHAPSGDSVPLRCTPAPPIVSSVPSGLVSNGPLPLYSSGGGQAPEGACPSSLCDCGWPQVCETIPSPVAGNYWYFRIAADRFLRNMVRATVGSLIEIGRGKHSPEWIAELIAHGTRSDAGESVPGHALFLNSVEY